ncbi:hypothetical protein ON010_g16130 [Phytophthora cinnamomi]|nr:hypothetical protein ON010_g16130 [Phytophthora cinnamomi]
MHQTLRAFIEGQAKLPGARETAGTPSYRVTHSSTLRVLASARPRVDSPHSSSEISIVNEFDQPVECALQNWSPSPFPPHGIITGRYCNLEPLEAVRSPCKVLLGCPGGGRRKRSPDTQQQPDHLQTVATSTVQVVSQYGRSPRPPVVVDGETVGILVYMQIDPSHGVVELGRVYFSRRLTKTVLVGRPLLYSDQDCKGHWSPAENLAGHSSAADADEPRSLSAQPSTSSGLMITASRREML